MSSSRTLLLLSCMFFVLWIIGEVAELLFSLVRPTHYIQYLTLKSQPKTMREVIENGMIQKVGGYQPTKKEGKVLIPPPRNP